MSDDRTQLDLDRLRVKHRRFADETNRLLTEQAREISRLRARLAEYHDERNDR